jgi:hypothetical protein
MDKKPLNDTERAAAEATFARILLEHMRACDEACPGRLTAPVDRTIGERGAA